MAAAGTSRTHAEVHSLEVEDGAEIHIDGGVHRLEDIGLSEQLGVVFLLHKFGRLNDRLCG